MFSRAFVNHSVHGVMDTHPLPPEMGTQPLRCDSPPGWVLTHLDILSWDTMGYGWQAGSMHPTGMHPYFFSKTINSHWLSVVDPYLGRITFIFMQFSETVLPNDWLVISLFGCRSSAKFWIRHWSPHKKGKQCTSIKGSRYMIHGISDTQ